MKKIVRPILLLSSVCCLVGCGKDSLPLISADFITAQGKCKQMCVEVMNYTFDSIKNKQIEYRDESKSEYINEDGTMMTSNTKIIKADFANRIIAYESGMSYANPDGTSGDDAYNFMYYYDEELGIVETIDNWLGKFATIVDSKEDIENTVELDDSYETVDDYVNDRFLNEYWSAGYDSYSYGYLLQYIANTDEIVASEEGSSYEFALNSDALEISEKYENEYNGYSMMGFSHIKTKCEGKYHFDGVYLTSGVYSGTQVNTDIATGEVVMTIKTTEKMETKMETKVSKPNLDEYYFVSLSEFENLW